MTHVALWQSRRTLLTRLTLVLLAAASLVAAPRGVSAAPRTFGQAITVAGYLYVNNNLTGDNSIAAFARWSDGHLTPLPNSPFNIGCCGTGAAVGSQDALQFSSDGRFLLAANPGSNTVAVLRIGASGGLTPVAGSPFYSGGVMPLSLAVHNQLVFVANAGANGSNYTGFTLGIDGSLRPIAGSTVSVPDSAGLGDVVISPDGSRLVGMRVNPSTIDSFAVDAAGHLTPASGSPFKAEGMGPFGSEFLPSNSNQLFVSNAHDGAGRGTVSAFAVAADGTLTAAKGSPFADQQTAPCWVAISPDGHVLFATNTMSDSVSAYTIAAGGTLTLAGSTTLSGGPKLGAAETRLDPTGHMLYVVDGSMNELSVLSVNGTTLTELSQSPMPLTGATKPFGLAVR